MSNLLAKTFSTTTTEGFLIVKVKVMSDQDVQTADQALPYGLDSNPIKDVLAVFHQTSVRADSVIGGYIQENSKAAPGEFRTYSTDGEGVEKFYTWIKADGTMEIGGSVDNLVRYSKLKIAFDELKADHNELAAKWDAFCSAYVPGSPSSVGLPASLASSAVGASSADIAPAKIDEIKTL